MTATPAVRIGIADSLELALARRSAAVTLADLVEAWSKPMPEAIVAAARNIWQWPNAGPSSAVKLLIQIFPDHREPHQAPSNSAVTNSL